jgi:hypothetical protein
MISVRQPKVGMEAAADITENDQSVLGGLANTAALSPAGYLLKIVSS